MARFGRMDGPFSSWPTLTSDEPLGVLPPSMMVSGPATRGPGRRWGSLNLCLKIFDKFAWIIIISFLSEDDPSGDGLEDDDKLKPVDDVD